ncbi:MAG: hypothetical protein ACM37W_23625 [Actinomycetota bacterium]
MRLIESDGAMPEAGGYAIAPFLRKQTLLVRIPVFSPGKSARAIRTGNRFTVQVAAPCTLLPPSAAIFLLPSYC